MGLIKDIKDIESISSNRFNITKEDLIGAIKDFPLGVVIRMLEETELQGNKADIKWFQKDARSDAIHGGFTWDKSENGYYFWYFIIKRGDYDEFYLRYPEYKQYD